MEDKSGKGSPERVKPKKRLGQHFLTDQRIAQKIAGALTGWKGYGQVLEVGPGMGVLTKYLIEDERFELHAVELDQESVEYLNFHFPSLKGRVYYEDFLRKDLATLFKEPFGLIGNFPYNISSQGR